MVQKLKNIVHLALFASNHFVLSPRRPFPENWSPFDLIFVKKSPIFKKIWKRLFDGGPPANKNLFAGGSPANKKLFAGGPLANKELFAGGPPENKKLFAEGPPANKKLFDRGSPENKYFGSVQK